MARLPVPLPVPYPPPLPAASRRGWMRSLARAVLLASCAAAAWPAAGEGLEEYVRRPDPSYGWSLARDEPGWLAHAYVLHLTSQRWLDSGQVDRPLWVHTLHGAQPHGFFCGQTASRSRTAVLIISGGRNRPRAAPERKVRAEAGIVANIFCRPVFELRHVPNQPLRFDGDDKGRTEDALIAASFDRYLRDLPGSQPAQLAMVKSVVQAMNAIQAFSRTRDEVPDIDDFVLIGTSKRGWTAWLTAAVDPRVRALIPVSIDMPNIPRQLAHHFGAYGDYAPALDDYKAVNIGCRLRGERGAALVSLVDPYAYRERLAMPKLILNATGDEFFVPDAWRFYLEQMPGANWLRYTLNTSHDQGSNAEREELFRMAASWVHDVIDGEEPPRLSWQRDEDGLLVVEGSRPPRHMLLWTADNPRSRDFRLETLGPVWRAQPLEPDADGRYRVRLAAPPAGWRAALVEATFGGRGGHADQRYTTGVFVTPDRMPFGAPDCGH